MNAISVLLVTCAGIGMVWYVVSSLLIYNNLRRRGEKVNFLLIRLMLPWYASRYKEITKSETGRTGPLFYHWVISINLTLLFVVAAVVVRLL